MSSVNLSSLSSGLFQNLSATEDQQLSPIQVAEQDALSANSAANSTSTTGSVAHHHHGGLFGKIQQSVLSALESGGSANSTDPNSIIQSAILNAINGGTGSDSDGDNDGSSTTAADSATSPTAFFQALQKYGVSQDQFAQDLKAAFQQNGGQGGQDLTGLLVNTTG